MAYINPALWESDPLQAYLQQLDIGAVGLTPYQQWQRQQFNPTYGTYLARSRLNPASAGQAAGNFGDFLGQDGIGNARQIAPAVFNQIGDLSQENQRAFWENMGGYSNDLVSNMLGQRYGRPMAGQMGQSFGALQSAFQGGPGYQDPNASFYTYLRQKYGL